MKKTLLILLISITQFSVAQNTNYLNETLEHKIYSEHLKENRDYWISLPLKYSDSLSYPVIYVFDAEWRFDLIKNITFDLGANLNSDINFSVFIQLNYLVLPYLLNQISNL